MQTVLTLAQERGAVRTDITAADVTQFFEMLRAIHIGDQASSDHFRRRYLSLFLTALRPSAATAALPVDGTDVAGDQRQLEPTGRPGSEVVPLVGGIAAEMNRSRGSRAH